MHFLFVLIQFCLRLDLKVFSNTEFLSKAKDRSKCLLSVQKHLQISWSSVFFLSRVKLYYVSCC